MSPLRPAFLQNLLPGGPVPWRPPCWGILPHCVLARWTPCSLVSKELELTGPLLQTPVLHLSQTEEFGRPGPPHPVQAQCSAVVSMGHSIDPRLETHLSLPWQVPGGHSDRGLSCTPWLRRVVCEESLCRAHPPALGSPCSLVLGCPVLHLASFIQEAASFLHLIPVPSSFLSIFLT